MESFLSKLSENTLIFFKYSAMAGFVTFATLLINLNFKAFNKIFKQKGFIYWCMFAAFSFIPLLVVIYFFNLFFIKVSIANN